MQVDILDTAGALEQARDDWEHVYDADPEAQYFLSWNWIWNWFRSRSVDWLVLAVRPGAGGQDSGGAVRNYVAFFPLRLTSELTAESGFRHALHMGASFYSGYTGFICDPRWEAQAIDALAAALQRLNWAELHLDDIFISETRLQRLFAGFPDTAFSKAQKTRGTHTAQDGQNIDHDIYVVVPLAPDWESFLQSNLGSKTRYNARNALRQVENNEQFRIAIADPDTIDDDLDTFIALWHSRWGKTNPGYADYMVSCTRSMIRACFDDGSIFVPVLWQGDERVAVNINLADRRKGRLIQFMAGRDQSVKRPPPGFVLHLFAIRWAIANGFKVYDFGTGNFSYKYDFGAEEILVRRYCIAARSGSNLHGQVDDSTLDLALGEIRDVLRAGKLALAETGCRAVLGHGAGHAAAREILGEIGQARSAAGARLAEAVRHHKEGRLEQASKLYQEVLKLDAMNFEAWHHLGLVLYQRGALDAAAKCLHRAVELNPGSPTAHNNLGSTLAGLGRLPEAVRSYDRALELRPDYEQARNNRAAALAKRKTADSQG